MELSPKEIDARNTRAAINVAVNQTLAPMDWDRMEKESLKEHPPLLRKSEPVSEGVRRVQVEVIKRRQTKIKKHVLP